MPRLVKSYVLWVMGKNKKTHHSSPSKSKGFTMIELLVVITVIGVLTAVAISTYSSVQAKARDVKRRSDVDEIRKALELYYVGGTQTPYQAPIGTMFDSGVVPKDPKPPTFAYSFTSTNPSYSGGLPTSGTFANYIVCALLEAKGGNSKDLIGTPPSSPGTDDIYYCRKNAQ